MSSYESEKRSVGEKAIWWAKVGGITAALLGALRHMSEATHAGIALVVGAYAAEGLIYRRPRSV